jgi:acyl-CoA synthetase (AMP-forming)/AMP-acid ligase II
VEIPTATRNPNVAALLAEKVARHPGRLAIVEYRRARRYAVTFEQLAVRAAAVVAGLQAAGIEPGDRVLLFVPMSIDLYAALLACFHLGAPAVFVDAWADRWRLDAAVAAARPRAFLGTPKAHLLRLISPSIRRIPVHLVAGRGWLSLNSRARSQPARPAAPVAPGDPALITFTTGSTGRPKAAARSHGVLLAQHRGLADLLRLTEADVDMPALPVFVLNNLALGIPSVLPDFDPRRPAEIDPAAIHRQLEAEGVTTASGSPAFFERLADWCRGTGRRLPLRALFTGGAPVLPPLARRLRDTVAGSAHVVYGSTEAEPVSGIEVGEMLAAMEEGGGPPEGLCVGRPVPQVAVRLIRPCDGPVVLQEGEWTPWEVGRGEVGEVVVAGEHVLPGYLDDPEADRRQKIHEGDRVWHRTGDAARLDEEGRLWLMGRVRERVERAGRTWWPQPAELRAMAAGNKEMGKWGNEEMRKWGNGEMDRFPNHPVSQFPNFPISTIPYVLRHAAYLGVPDPALGQRAVLCVETPTGRLADEARELLLVALAPIPVDELRVLRRIPRDPRHASKTDMEALRRILARCGSWRRAHACGAGTRPVNVG